MSVAAVVVSFNRLDDLKKCLTALERQTRRIDEIIVVENGSTDGSADYVRQNHPGITLFETGENLGGAGGFAWGMEIAMAAGHAFAWLMDDDAEPEVGSLAPLVKVMEAASSPKPAFAWSVVKDFEGNLNPGHLPKISRDPQKQLAASSLGAVAVDQATFVGLLVNLDIARENALPFEDYFIWFDDAEYSSRLAEAHYGLLVPESVVMHPATTGASPDMGWRLFYYVRNGLWTNRLHPVNGSLLDGLPFYTLATLMVCIRQLPAAADKRLWFASVLRGLYQGLTKLPKKTWPGEKIAERQL